MTRIAPIGRDAADTRTATTLRAVEAKLGMLPNMFATFAHAPSALNGYLQLAESVAGGRLSAAQREQLAIAVADANRCEYCLSAHAALGRGAGLDDTAISLAREGRAHDARDGAILKLALAINHNRGEISDAQIVAAREAGLDDGLIVEIVANVALNVLTNYLNRVAGTEIDFPRLALSAAA